MIHRYKGYVIDEDQKSISYNGEVIRDDSLYIYAERIYEEGEGFYLFDKEGNEFNSAVTDHNIWYYRAKEECITHWFNE